MLIGTAHCRPLRGTVSIRDNDAAMCGTEGSVNTVGAEANHHIGQRLHLADNISKLGKLCHASRQPMLDPRGQRHHLQDLFSKLNSVHIATVKPTEICLPFQGIDEFSYPFVTLPIKLISLTWSFDVGVIVITRRCIATGTSRDKLAIGIDRAGTGFKSLKAP